MPFPKDSQGIPALQLLRAADLIFQP